MAFQDVFTREEWYALPLELRQRWWQETEFDRKPADGHLIRAVQEALKNEKR